MAKLTRAQRTQVAGALAEVSAALNYLMGDNISVCRRGVATTKLHFTRPPVPDVLLTSEMKARGDYALFEVAKGIGSPLCKLRDAQKRLGELFVL